MKSSLSAFSFSPVLTAFFAVIYIFFQSYFSEIYISPDTANYLRQAENLYQGYGFNSDGLAGGYRWFSVFPIMYPFLISLVMKILGTNAYLSSKILICLCMLLLSFAFVKRFKTNTLFYSVIFLNFGILQCAFCSWSEVPFVLFVVMAVFSLSDFLESVINGKSVRTSGAKLLLFCIMAFLIRYFGLFLFCVVFVCSIYMLLSDNEKMRWGGAKLFLVDILFAIFVTLYFLLNHFMSGYVSGGKRFVFNEHYMDLTENLLTSLVEELFSFFGNTPLGVLQHFSLFPMFNCMCLVAFLVLLLWSVRKNVFKGISLNAKLFLFSGVSYYIIFIAYRYMSTMDLFGFRFFAPGSTLLAVGLLNILSEKYSLFSNRIRMPFFILLLFIIGAYMFFSIRDYKDLGYQKTVVSWNKKYGWLQPKSVVYFSYSKTDFDIGLLWYRADIMFVEGSRYTLESINTEKNYGRQIYLDKVMTTLYPHVISQDQLKKCSTKENFYICEGVIN